MLTFAGRVGSSRASLTSSVAFFLVSLVEISSSLAMLRAAAVTTSDLKPEPVAAMVSDVLRRREETGGGRGTMVSPSGVRDTRVVECRCCWALGETDADAVLDEAPSEITSSDLETQRPVMERP